jgi:hypothetical protein
MFNHHKCLTDIGVKVTNGLVPKTKTFNWYKFKRYFSIKRIKEAEDFFDILFNISWQDFKDEVEFSYQKLHTDNKDYYNINNAKFNIVRTLIYFYDSIKYEIKSKWEAYKNYWQYGFWDSDETFSLDYVSTIYLYERVKRYKDLASKWVYIYPEKDEQGNDKVDTLHKFKKIPVITLKDTEELKELYDKDPSTFYNDDESIVKVEYKDLYQYECIDLILDYLERAIKSDAGQYIFEYNYKDLETETDFLDDMNQHFKELNEKYPDHLFWHSLEERYANILTSYAFQIYGKIINSMWW